MKYEFTAKLWEWDAATKSSWYFVSLPKDQGAEIKEITSSGLKRGFGSVRVEVTVGSSKWMTSIFPSNEEKTYVLPVKKSVRKAENINDGDAVKVKIELTELR